MNRRLFLMSGCLLVLTTGCSDPRPEGLPELHPATITVMQDGAPLSGAAVTLVPQDPALTRWPAGGTTNDSGVVDLYTHSTFPGAPAGTFKVTVSKTTTEGDPKPTHPGPNATHEQLSAYDRAMKTGTFETFQVVAAEHRMPSTTQLSIEVTAGGPNEFTLDVGSAVKEKEANASASARSTQAYRPMGE